MSREVFMSYEGEGSGAAAIALYDLLRGDEDVIKDTEIQTARSAYDQKTDQRRLRTAVDRDSESRVLAQFPKAQLWICRRS